MGVTWYGNQIARRVTEAAIEAVDETTQAAADAAQQQHWWASRGDNNLQRQTINEHAEIVEDGAVAGRFGTTRRKGFYGLFLELQQPFLRPAADQEFPHLGERMAEKLAR